jgi:hypothetical protein
VSFFVPTVERDGVTPLLGSCKSENFSVQYYVRCFTKVKSVFELGQGECIQFPVLIVSKPPTDAPDVPPLDNTFGINPRALHEFSESDETYDFTFNFPRQNLYWGQPTAEPSFVKFTDLQNDKLGSEMKLAKPPLKQLKTVPSMYDKENMVPVDTEQKYYIVAWPDAKGVDEPDWLAKQGLQLDTELWWTQWKEKAVISDDTGAALMNEQPQGVSERASLSQDFKQDVLNNEEAGEIEEAQ